jgi:hypothetical protein
VDWGLPSSTRVRILTHDTDLTDADLARLDATTESYLVNRRAADSLSVQRLEAGQFPSRPRTDPLGPVFTDENRLRAFRRYLISGSGPDEREPYIALARMRPPKLDFDPHGFLYGGAYLYPLGGWLFLLRSVSVLSLDPRVSHYIGAPEDAAHMYIAGRMLSLLPFLGVLILLGRFGRIMGHPFAGTAAMLCWALSTLPLNQAVLTKPHVWTAFWATLGVYLLHGYILRQRTRDLVLSSIATGIAVGSSLFAAVMLLFYPILLLRRGKMRESLAHLGLASCLCLVTFLITNPYALLNPESFRVTLTYHGSSSGWGYAMPSLGKSGAFLGDVLLRSFCFPISILGAATAVLTLGHKHPTVRRLAAAWIASLALLGVFLGVARIALFVGPILCLFAGWGAERIRAWKPNPFRTAGVILLVVLFIPGLFLAGLSAYDTIRDDAWVGATESWVNILGSETIVGVFENPEPRNAPPLPFLACSLVNLGAYRGGPWDPDYVLLGNYTDDRKMWEEHPLRSRYTLTRVLGYRDSMDWLLSLRTRSESRLAGWVFEPAAE